MMEKLFWHGQEEDETGMPPGFRFHPTDEELITHYLLNKVVDNTFFAKAIGEVNMNRTEPWELPGVAKMGEKEWYFFCFRDKKYPTGLRTNRATAAGYWKATGKDKEIFRGRLLVGKKKTLVFYMGRAPKGEKTNWIIHEFRLESLFSLQNLPKSVKNEWVICRVSHKTSDGKKVHFSELKKKDSGGGATSLPPLMDSPAWVALGGRIINPNISEWTESTHVPCFSNPIEIQITHNTMVNHFLNDPISSSNPSSNSLLESQYDPLLKQFHPVPPFSVHDQSILRGLVDTYDYGSKMKVTVSQDTGVISEKNIEISWIPEKGKRGIEDEEAPSTSAGPVDLACLWNY